MGNPSVTYTFVNGAGNYIDATEVNKNFTDLVNAIVSGSTADLGCGSIKINTIPFASAVISSIAGASISPTTIVLNSVPFSSAVISSVAGANIAPANVSAVSDLYGARATITKEYAGQVIVGSAASEGAGTLVTESWIHTHSNLTVDGDINAGSNKIYDHGSFVATLGGVDTPTSVTGYYALAGDIVSVFLPAAGMNATSNTGYLYISGLPAAIIDLNTSQPAFVVPSPNVAYDNGASVVSHNVGILMAYDTGNLDRVYFTLDGTANGWNSAGAKGFNTRIAFQYPLTDRIM